ncbi:MAG: amidohydrolase [Planctomycetes bacterium]|nr:amidohydrolase [Planctomycetota bacterium]
MPALRVHAFVRRVLVAACALALAGGVAAAQSAPPATPPAPTELLVVNGRIHAADGATALLARGERIVSVGKDAEVRALASPGAAVLDAAGGAVLPGFHDAHLHLVSGGVSLTQLDISNQTTMEGALAAIRKYAEEHHELTWIQGRGWQYGLVPTGSFPSRKDLDRAVADRPALLESYDGHAAWANTKALERAGVTAATPDPPGGRVVREEDGKTPQGALLEGAGGLLDDALPATDRDAQLRALEAALRYCLELGLTSVDDIGGGAETFAMHAELQAAGRSCLRVTVSPPLGGNLDSYRKLRRRYVSPTLRFGFLKAFVDGVIESKTAYMLEPYEGGKDRGKPQLQPRRLKELIARAHAGNFPVALHAIGDGAVRLALDAFEEAQARHPEFRPRHRIEHIEVVDPKDVPRFRELGVLASMQPFHANPFGPTPDQGVWSENLGPRRLPMTFAWKALLAAGAHLAFGSDWPVMTADPLAGLAVATTRQDEKGQPEKGWNPQHALTIDEAIDAYTTGSADAVSREEELGRLAPGFLADLVVLPPDARLDAPRSLWGKKVRHVVIGGVVRFSRP